ncbi:MFS transporter [Mycobacterium sp. PS03-16]|uniref:MFS transporter n=1 Tax=Mycobacterium sp. PS03-16 TaxID=2559611 RepID=UPI0010732051|nr:MFS transporter [Mycobacterium sp. PS03-16]TFV57829.1 MFS transporter [Mycobacterium sp. PS03-16]
MATRGVGSARREQAGTGRSLRQVARAGYVGSAIEFYDFFIYGTAAALVFPTVFFPDLGHVMATTASLAAFATAFVSRPIGAAVFGHFGDRIGRKQVLVITLLLMGVSTVGVGLIPGTDTIGIAAPLLLIVLRLVQGFAVGGEWAGSALLSAEHAPADRRGFYGMFTQLGLGTALVMANLVFLVVHLAMDETSSAFLQWGWRIPFLLSAGLIATALYIRLRVQESPVHAEATTEDHHGLPLAALMREQGRGVLLAAGAATCVPMLVYQAGTFFTHYAEDHMDYPTGLILLVGVIGGVCAVGCAAASAILSDTRGRRRVLLIGAAVALPWSVMVFPLIGAGSEIVFSSSVVATYAVIGFCMGPLASFLPELFAARYRYTGAALALNLGGIVGGAVPPVISPTLYASFGTWGVAAMMGAVALVSLVSLVLLPETAGRTAPAAS